MNLASPTDPRDSKDLSARCHHDRPDACAEEFHYPERKGQLRCAWSDQCAHMLPIVLDIALLNLFLGGERCLAGARSQIVQDAEDIGSNPRSAGDRRFDLVSGGQWW